MPYISQLLNNRVHDSSDGVVGRLEDILISPTKETFAPLEYLVVKTRPDKAIRFVPYDFVANFTSSQIALKNLFNKIALPALPGNNYIHLKRDILDRQIVDLAGTRVVRVNDLRIGSFENKMCVLAIDSSFRGILRRLGLEGSILAKPFNVNLIDWRQAQLVGNGPLQLNINAESLGHLHPADLANIVEELDVNQGSRLLVSLGEREAAKVLEEVKPRLQNILIKYLGPERAGKILAQMSSDEIVDWVKTLSREEARKFLSQVNGGKTKTIEKLIAYPNNTAGGLMTLEFVSVRPEWTLKQAVEEVKRLSSNMRSILYIYVTAEDGKLIGVVSMRNLLFFPQETLMRKLAKHLASHSTLKPGDKLSRIIKVMTKYNLHTAAVLDGGKKILGIVTIDDVMRQLYPTA